MNGNDIKIILGLKCFSILPHIFKDQIYKTLFYGPETVCWKSLTLARSLYTKVRERNVKNVLGGVILMLTEPVDRSQLVTSWRLKIQNLLPPGKKMYQQNPLSVLVLLGYGAVRMSVNMFRRIWQTGSKYKRNISNGREWRRQPQAQLD